MQKTKVCYARVSSEHQRGITDYRPLTTLSGHKIISDIGSELNWKRKGFVFLLERVYSNEIEEV
ncbi:18279_t:CDS:1, partial [Funneliformis geosporum]